ncbi:MAG: lipid A biosynthesis lauroyl acyltransferase [Pirellulaceae bacterium]|nr:MAG: lipid A biosynthesis lauroyl acyltransferase [Pirellulaceae bacterium]
MLRTVADWIVYCVVRIAVCVAQVLTPETCQVIASFAGWFIEKYVPVRRKVIDENLAAAFPEWTPEQRRRAVQGLWQHLVLMFFEIAQAPHRLRLGNWRQYVEVEDLRVVVEFLLARRPRLLVSGHFGNFEVGGYLIGLLGIPTYSVAQPINNRWLDRYINYFRSLHGQRILPKVGSALSIDNVLRNGNILSVLGDQHAGPRGCWVEFFGRPASAHKSLAILCMSHQAVMAVMTARRTGGFLRYRVSVVDEIDACALAPPERDVAGLTHRYHKSLELAIRLAPEQYWWLHRRWKGTPPARRKAANKAA